MKVDITTSHQPGAPGEVDATRNKESERAQQTPKPGGDRVDLSTEATLLAEALHAAEQIPDVRHDLVAQMREKVARGEVGNDVTRLADTMIGRLLEQ